MKNKRNLFISIMTIITLIAVLWVGGIIPKQIGKITAINYVQNNYSDKNLEFISMDFSPAHGSYFARFEDKEGNTYNFEIINKYLPVIVWGDPLQKSLM